MFFVMLVCDYDFWDLLKILYLARWIELNSEVYAGKNVA